MTPRRDRLLFAAWTVWACAVLGSYYVTVLRAVAARRLPSDFDALSASLPVLLVAGGALIVRLIGLRPHSFPSLRRGPRQHLSDRAAAAVLGLAGIAAVPWLFAWPRIATTVSRFTAPHFPFAGEAAARAAIALIGAALVSAAALSAGTLVLRVIGWRTTSRSEHVLFAAVSGILVVSYGSLLLAVLGFYRPLTVAALIGALCIAGLPVARQVRAGVARVSTPLGAIDGAAPWLILAGVALAYALIAALAPEKEYDALWYHLHLPRLWLDAGRPVDLLEEYVSLYPLTWELMFGAGMVLGGGVGAKLLHFACLPLLAGVVWHAARRYVPGASAAAAAALVVTTPTMLWQAGTAYVDLALALHAAAACYALARYAEEGERAWGAVAALQFGAAAATKHLGVVVTVVALSLYVLAAIRYERRWTVAGRRALLLAIGAALVPTPWYIRSWRASGNPVFPEMFAVFGASPPERWDALTERGLAQFKAHFGSGHSLGDLLALPWDVTVHGALFGGSLGPLFLMLLPGVFLVRRRRTALPWLGAGIIGYVAFWASPISSYQMRFLMPIVPPLALFAATSLNRVTAYAEERFSHGRGWLTAVVLLLGTMNLPPFTRLHEADRAGWDGWLTHVVRAAPLRVVIGRESEAAYLRREVPSFAAWQSINARLPADARILTFTGGDRLYAQRRYVPHDATIARPAIWATAQEGERSATALRDLGITHVLFDRRELSRLTAASLAIGSGGVQQACTSEYDDRRFWLCRLDYARLLPAGKRNME